MRLNWLQTVSYFNQYWSIVSYKHEKHSLISVGRNVVSLQRVYTVHWIQADIYLSIVCSRKCRHLLCFHTLTSTLTYTTWTNAGILLIGPLGTNSNEILIWHLFCLGLNELKMWYNHLSTTYYPILIFISEGGHLSKTTGKLQFTPN